MIFSGHESRNGISGSYDTSLFSVEERPCCFPQWLHHLHSHQDCRRIPFSVHSVWYLFFVDLFDDGHCDQCEVIPHCSLIGIDLIIADVEYLSMCFDYFMPYEYNLPLETWRCLEFFSNFPQDIS